MNCPCKNCIALPMCVTVKSNRLDILVDKCNLLSEWLRITDTKLMYEKGKVYQIFMNHGRIGPAHLEQKMKWLKQSIPHLDIKVHTD